MVKLTGSRGSTTATESASASGSASFSSAPVFELQLRPQNLPLHLLLVPLLRLLFPSLVFSDSRAENLGPRVQPLAKNKEVRRRVLDAGKLQEHLDLSFTDEVLQNRKLPRDRELLNVGVSVPKRHLPLITIQS